MKRITFKSGPLKDKTYDVPVNTSRHDLAGGYYEIDGDTATWRTGSKQELATTHIERVKDAAPNTEHTHTPVQHRDGKEPWCKTCELNKNHETPTSNLATQG